MAVGAEITSFYISYVSNLSSFRQISLPINIC